ncbi:MAG: M1 family aminopeptidase [candidate division KSB1 bacterium]|nr:M1 family aminopeptidase [candidate division KSB1 bacterium]MDZ7303617.1 M1 family aminopeptidase [candidate division KSB1 bacterium]MDZ7312854.1 M1 family aminopeptidase [candidate division KSB1 bacterium]
MNRTSRLIVILLLTVSSSGQTRPADNNCWQQEVRYQIEAVLDTSTKSLNGNAVITYKNNSPDTLRRIYLQVPANAFLDEENTAVKEMRRFQGSSVQIIQHADYQLTVQSVQFHAVGRETDFPLRAFNFRDTILDLPLPAPLLPGDSLRLSVSYTQDYQKAFGSSTSGDRSNNRRLEKRRLNDIQIDFVHWFPRVAVYDRNGWNAEPFHFMMSVESVHSEFATLDVTVIVPGNYIVVGSGEVMAGDPGWNAVTADTAMKGAKFLAWQDSVRKDLRKAGPRRVQFHVKRARNFIWSASPAFVRSAMSSLCTVNVFERAAEQPVFARKIFQELDGMLQYLRNNVGDYPLPQLNIVAATRRETSQPAMILLEGGDTFNLIFALSRLYFPGIVGSDGARESWMINGLALYFAKDFAAKRHGKLGYDADSARKDLGVFAKLYPLPSIDGLLRNFTRMYMNSGQNEPIANSIHQYKDLPGMFFNSFMKAELLYEMLRYVVGDSTFTEILQRYFREWSFKNADAAAFIDICEQTSGQDLDWFFDQWLHQTPTVDYQKGEVVKRQRADGSWVTEVEIKRRGDGIMPVEVELERSDGGKEVKRWDGRSESGKIVFETQEKPGRVVVDPNDQIMDNNLLNNGRRRFAFKPDLPFMRYLFMPGDAYVVLWRPDVWYNSQDGVRLGAYAQTSYRAFYHNLTLLLTYGFLSQSVDGKIAYSHPLRRNNVQNRYTIFARKNEGRFEADANLQFQFSSRLIATTGASLQFGINYSRLLDEAYTFRVVANDTGDFRLPEWENQNILFAYLQTGARLGARGLEGETEWRAEITLPSSEANFTKITGRTEISYRLPGVWARVRGNVGTSFGPDRLPLQDVLHGEGADARTRFRHDKVKSGGEWIFTTHRLVEGGGNLRGYTGTPLLAEKYATFNFEFGPRANLMGLSLFGFYDHGAIWPARNANAFTRANAGLALSFGQTSGRGFLSLLTFRIYSPFWLSHTLPGEQHWQFRWYFALGKAL